MEVTATEELRRMLDERGVEWDYGITGSATTRFSVNGIDLTFTPMRDGLVCSTILTPTQAVEATLGARITGDTSDGYHTFNELYHHRAVLFSVIVRDHQELAWKSKAHHDGTMYDGMFIVGIETPNGQATYHYDIDPYWDMFDCKELERAPEWDGHTPDEAIERIATLGRRTWVNPTWERWHRSLRHDEIKSVGDAVEQLMYEAIEFGGDMGPNGNTYNGIDEGDVLTAGYINEWVERFENMMGAGTCYPIISENLAKSGGTGDAWADCSECGQLLFVLTDPSSKPPNYCPNCGAKVVDE